MQVANPNRAQFTKCASYAIPYTTYGICVWGLAAKSYINKLLALQKRALRLIYFAPSNAHDIPFFIETKFLPVNMIYFDTVANLMHDIWKGLTCDHTLPPYISSLFSLPPPLPLSLSLSLSLPKKKKEKKRLVASYLFFPQVRRRGVE